MIITVSLIFITFAALSMVPLMLYPGDKKAMGIQVRGHHITEKKQRI